MKPFCIHNGGPCARMAIDIGPPHPHPHAQVWENTTYKEATRFELLLMWFGKPTKTVAIIGTIKQPPIAPFTNMV